jgi:sugar-specific transcriptional regulator TrmB
LNHEPLINALQVFGLRRAEVQVYIFLAKKGPCTGKDLIKGLKLTKQQVYLILKNLRKKGVAKFTLTRPLVFSAVPIERILDAFIKANIEETQHMIQNKEALLSSWRSLTEKDEEKS